MGLEWLVYPRFPRLVVDIVSPGEEVETLYDREAERAVARVEEEYKPSRVGVRTTPFQMFRGYAITWAFVWFLIVYIIVYLGVGLNIMQPPLTRT